MVQELTSLGFGPDVVRDFVRQGDGVLHAMTENHNPDEETAVVTQSHATTDPGFTLLYEVDNDFGRLVPRLRLIVSQDIDLDTTVSDTSTTMTSFLTQGTAREALYPHLNALGKSPNRSVSGWDLSCCSLKTYTHSKQLGMRVHYTARLGYRFL